MTTSAAPMTQVPGGRPRSRRGLIAGGVLVAVLGIFGWMLYGGMEDNLVYFLTPKELHAKGTKAIGRPVRLGGQVVPGSVQWNAEQLDLRFKVTDGEREIAVHSKGAPPQMFRAGIGVVVEGKYGRNAVFESNSLMVKHSNEYKAPEAGTHPPRLDKTLIRPAT
ncbi:MAG: cytochrome c maturation protein CcmE [Gemmatimonadaceae bacterium]|jgi:cytochrome c-type biogenesis protein CcmE|nr:cytochrome c maturation protein CcmE [Gemmatimonadaceae bacterium]